MHELAFGISGFNAGFKTGSEPGVRNAYDATKIAGGSSSGTGAAIGARIVTAGLGTDTGGSVRQPASLSGVVGLKPTYGRVSRYGLIAFASSLDTVGTLTRSVRDAALLLGAMAGKDHAAAVKDGALQGARIGIARKQYFGYSDAADALVNRAIDDMKAAGAVIVDPADIPTASKMDACEMDVLLYEFKADLNKYLASRGPAAAVHSLEELIAFDEREKAREMPYFGQELFLRAQAKGGLDSKEYQEALATNRKLSRAEGIDKALAENDVEALVAPSNQPAWLTDFVKGDASGGGFTQAAAVAGYPHVTVPAGWYHGLPLGMSLIGAPFTEGKLLGYAFAFEQATRHRRPPQYFSTAPL